MSASPWVSLTLSARNGCSPPSGPGTPICSSQLVRSNQGTLMRRGRIESPLALWRVNGILATEVADEQSIE